MSAESTVAWKPRVPGIAEVFCAHFVEHAYPMHTHDAWTLLIVDGGRIGYELGGLERGSEAHSVTLLPPHVPHDGHSLTAEGFDKRVLYLDEGLLDGIGRAVGAPTLLDPALRAAVGRLHGSLRHAGDEFEASSRLALVVDRLQWHLAGTPDPPPVRRERAVAHALRDLLDADVPAGMTLERAGSVLHAAPSRLVREFAREFGIPPHRYLTGRRVELARRMLLDGAPPAEVAVGVGFHDQSHLTRHFTAIVGTPPGRYARSGQGRLNSSTSAAITR